MAWKPSALNFQVLIIILYNTSLKPFAVPTPVAPPNWQCTYCTAALHTQATRDITASPFVLSSAWWTRIPELNTWSKWPVFGIILSPFVKALMFCGPCYWICNSYQLQIRFCLPYKDKIPIKISQYIKHGMVQFHINLCQRYMEFLFEDP